MADSIGKLAEEIITQYYKQTKSDNSNYTLRHVAEQIATEIAFFAKADALEMDRLGESVYSNDQFICSYIGLELLTEATTQRKCVLMPNTPVGLPQGRELAYIAFTGNKKIQIFPMRSKDRFMQSFTTTPPWMVLAYIEGQYIYLDNVSALVSGPVDVNLVGSLPIGTEITELPLLLPKDRQSQIFDKILNRMLGMRNVLPDNRNDLVSK